MNSLSLSIGGLPMCGLVSNEGRMTVSTSDLWRSYCRWVEKSAEGRPVGVISAEWRCSNGEVLQDVLPFSGMPKAHFITLSVGNS